MSVSLRRRGWVLSDPDSRSGEGGSPKRDSEEVARVERNFSSRGVIHGICGNGVELGIWGLSGVYAMPMQCGKLCKLIWYDRNSVWRARQRRIPYFHMSVSLRRRGWVLSDPDSRSGEGGSPKRDSEEVARVERNFSSSIGHMMGMELVEFSSTTNGRGVLSMGPSVRLGCFTTDEESVGQDYERDSLIGLDHE
ncbi:hypothetical protein DEO72_LG4g11 [Vigna unguiculata]|uniref:Uncharacterized protein n=1 Tax=Vigna unguiculata TaxID=3917 RepID=A0A4D6LKM7_VIGUN|nr:hypothetical protein DEO72_LG4g11 [Vigna unguiculata]